MSYLANYISGPARDVIKDRGVKREILKLISSMGGSFGSGGSGSAFTALSGTTWDGTNKYTTLTANTALTLTTTANSGILYVKQDGTGSRTLSINGQSLAISSGADTDTAIGFLVINGYYVFTVDTSVVAVVIPVPDTTAPTIVSAEATDDNHVTVTFSEAVSGTIAGWSLSNGGTLVINTHTGSGTNSWEFETNNDMSVGEIITYAYSTTSGGDTVDLAGNPLASVSGSVTNSISAGGVVETYPWFMRFDAGLDVTKTGTDVTQINDQVHNAGGGPLTQYDLSQTATGQFPEFVSSGINGLPAFRVDNTKYAQNQLLAPFSFPVTIVSVWKPEVLISSGIDYASAGPGYGVYAPSGTPKYFMYVSSALPTSTITADTNPHVFFYYYYADGSMETYRDDTLVVSTGAGGSGSTLYVRAYLGSSGSAAQKLIANYMIYQGIINSTDRTAITNELKTTYGIA